MPRIPLFGSESRQEPRKRSSRDSIRLLSHSSSMNESRRDVESGKIEIAAARVTEFPADAGNSGLAGHIG